MQSDQGMKNMKVKRQTERPKILLLELLEEGKREKKEIYN